MTGPQHGKDASAVTGKQRRKPRLRDIAVEAGVGVATVERVLNARGNVTPETARRVLIAAQSLGYDRTLPSLYRASIRIEVILVRPDSPFFSRINHAFQVIAPTLDRVVKLYRTFLKENTPEEIAQRIEDVAAHREREALIIVAQDHPRIVQALRNVDRLGIPVVLLVSDVAYQGSKAIYVGIDNESAGRTAGFLLRQSLGRRSGTVLTLCHSGRYVVHRQRVIGFSQYFGDLDDTLVFGQCLITGDVDELAFAAVSKALAADSAVVGIYHAGGGNAGAVRAIRHHRRPGEVAYIGHELNSITRRFLDDGAMLFAIDQEPERQVERAIETIERLIGLRSGTPNRSPIPFRIITPENLG